MKKRSVKKSKSSGDNRDVVDTGAQWNTEIVYCSIDEYRDAIGTHVKASEPVSERDLDGLLEDAEKDLIHTVYIHFVNVYSLSAARHRRAA